jgi:hypothetical protein
LREGKKEGKVGREGKERGEEEMIFTISMQARNGEPQIWIVLSKQDDQRHNSILVSSTSMSLLSLFLVLSVTRYQDAGTRVYRVHLKQTSQ